MCCLSALMKNKILSIVLYQGLYQKLNTKEKLKTVIKYMDLDLKINISKDLVFRSQ